MYEITVKTNDEAYNKSWKFPENNFNGNMREIEFYIGVLLHIATITKIEVLKSVK